MCATVHMRPCTALNRLRLGYSPMMPAHTHLCTCTCIQSTQASGGGPSNNSGVVAGGSAGERSSPVLEKKGAEPEFAQDQPTRVANTIVLQPGSRCEHMLHLSGVAWTRCSMCLSISLRTIAASLHATHLAAPFHKSHLI
jgi:hypothetical protein